MSSTALAIVEESPVAKEVGGLTRQLLSLLPGPDAVRRFQRVTIQALVKNPDLLECTPDSVVQAVLEAAAMGLEPTGAVGGAYLVPRNVNVGTKDRPRYEKQAQLIPDYRGVAKMVTRPRMDGSPSEVLKVEWRVVKEGDDFAWTEGTEPTLSCTPALAPDRSARPTTHVYAVGTLRSGATVFDVMDHAAVERIRKRGKPKAFSPWDSDWDEMAKARVVKRLCKMLPVEPVVLAIISREDEQAGQPDEPAPAPAVTGGRTRQLAARLRPQPDPEPAQDAPQSPPERVAPTGAADEKSGAQAQPEDATEGIFAEAPDEPAAGDEDRDTLLATLRGHASQSGLAGATTQPQQARLREAFAGMPAELVQAGLLAAFGHRKLETAAEAQAVVVVADSLGDAFQAAWAGLGEGREA